jgi:hypothetical protein
MKVLLTFYVLALVIMAIAYEGYSPKVSAQATYNACSAANNLHTTSTPQWIAKGSKAWDNCYNSENASGAEFLCNASDSKCWVEK